MKRLFIVFIALSVILCSCSIKTDPNSESSTPSQEAEELSLSSLSLPFFSSDSLNPFTVKSTVNISLIPLMYDSLVKVENNFTETLCLASSIVKSGRVYTVTLRDDVLFSDGSALTAEDVVFSINTGKTYQSYFKNKLDKIASAYENKDGQVIITLASDDIYGILNFDFPISKKVSNINNTVGTGRYILKDGALFKNDRHWGNLSYTFDSLTLVSLPDNESLFLSIKTNSVNIIPADLSLGSFSGLSGSTKKVNSSNMVYLGLSSSGAFADPNIRKLINASIDRELLSSRVISSSALPSALPIHPDKTEIFSLNKNKTLKDQASFDQALSGEGITKTGEGIFYGEEKLEIEILLPSDNAFKKSIATVLKAQLEESGFSVTLREEVFETYKASVAAGKFDIYIGEIKLSNSMNLSPLLTSSEFCIGPTPTFLASYNTFLASESGENEFIDSFYNELPFLPLLFKNAQLAYTRSIEVEIKTGITDTYSNINELK